MGLEFLEEYVGRNLEDNIRDEKDRERGIIFRPFNNIQIFLESKNGGIGDIHSEKFALALRPSPNDL